METGLGSKPVHHLDATYEPSQAEGCHLALRFTPDAAEYAVIELERNVVMAAGRLPSQSDETSSALLLRLLKEEVFQGRFQSVSLGVDRVPMALVPQSFQTTSSVLPGFSFGLSTTAPSYQTVEALKATVAYEMPDGLSKALHASFPHATCHHNGGQWIQSALRKNRFARGAQLFLDVSETGMSAYLLDGAHLKLYNHFRVEGQYDVLYHALNVCQQHQLEPSDVQLRVSGQVDANDELLGVLKTHFPKVEVNFGLDFQRMALGLSRVKKQHFAALFNQYVCVS